MDRIARRWKVEKRDYIERKCLKKWWLYYYNFVYHFIICRLVYNIYIDIPFNLTNMY